MSSQDQSTDPLTAYHQKLVQELSASRYRFDTRFVQLTLLIDRGPDAAEGQFAPDGRRGKYENLGQLLAEIDEPAAVLLGNPGCGKTTLLKHLQLEHARASLFPSATPTVAATPTAATSLFLPLNTYRGSRPHDPPPDPYDWLAAGWQRQHPHLPAFADLFGNGRLLLLLDGLNEIPHHDQADYRARVSQWQLFWRQYAHCGNTLLFSCRSLNYSAHLSSHTTPVRQVQVEPLTPTQIQAYLELNLPAHAQMVGQALQQDPKQMELYATPFFLQLLVEDVAPRGQMPPGRAALFTNLVRRALHRETQSQDTLFAPPELLSEDDVQQIIQDDWPHAYDLPAEGPLLPALATLAFQMQAGRRGGEKGQVSILEKEALSLLDTPQARPIIAAGLQLNALDKKRGELGWHITFYHQLLQEYFAARRLAQQPEPQWAAVPWRTADISPTLAVKLAGLTVSEPLPPLDASGWEQTALLAAAMSDPPQHFVADLIPVNLPWAARCAAAPDVPVSDALKAKLQQLLIARVGDPQADLRARIDAAEALGELGDPRFARRSGPHGDYLRPPLAAIAAGTYPMGDDNSQWSDEKPAHTVEMAAFELGVFPVTNAEYELFLRAGGYEDEQWWQTEAAKAWWRGESTSEGQKIYYRDRRQWLQDRSEETIQSWENYTPEEIEAQLSLKHMDADALERQLDEWFPAGKVYRQPKYWDDGRFNHPSRPIVGICWFEAQAYCAWLSAQTGERFGLPTEAEWEAAARGKTGRAYAYGPEFDSTLGNTFETHIRRTTPIGVFPGGQTPEGIADHSGNVWEWTTTLWGNDLDTPDFAYPYVAADGREDPHDPQTRRVVRGGSWFNAQNYARAAFRFHNPPVNRVNDVGCRLVRRSPSQ